MAERSWCVSIISHLVCLFGREWQSPWASESPLHSGVAVNEDQTRLIQPNRCCMSSSLSAPFTFRITVFLYLSSCLRKSLRIVWGRIKWILCSFGYGGTCMHSQHWAKYSHWYYITFTVIFILKHDVIDFCGDKEFGFVGIKKKLTCNIHSSVSQDKIL